MGVTLPNFTALGLRDPQAVGGQPSFPQESAVAAGEAALGVGLQKAGQGIETAAAYGQIARTNMDRSMADANWYVNAGRIDDELKAQTDLNKIPEIQSRYRQAAQTAAQAFSDPYAKQKWLLDQERHIDAGERGAKQHALGLWRDGHKANMLSQADAVVQAGMNDDDPRAFQFAAERIKALAESGAEVGSLTPVQAHNFLKQGQQNLIAGRVGALTNKGRAAEALTLIETHAADLEAVAPGTVERLRAHVQTKNDHLQGEAAANWLLGKGPKPTGHLPGMSAGGAIGNRVAETLRARGWSEAAVEGALNNAMTESSLNPTAKGAAGEIGLFQFHPRSHIGPFEQAYGRDWSPEAQANYVADVVDRAMPGYAKTGDAKEATARFLREFERPKDQSDRQLNARLANSGASRTILTQTASGAEKTSPGSATPPGMQAASVAEADTGSDAPAGGATGGGALRNRTGMPSLSEQFDRIQSLPISDAAKQTAWARYKDKYLAMEADAERNGRLAAQQQKQSVLDAENEIWGKLYKPDSGLTAEQVSVDPRLNSDPEKRRHLIEIIHNPPGSDIPTPQSAKAAMSLIDRIRLPYGDPNKITDSNDIYDHKREMNWSEFDRVMKTFNDNSTPGGETLKQLRTNFLRDFKGFITTSNPLSGKDDPRGDQRVFEFDRYIDERIADAREHKKNPLDLFNRKSPDYLGLPDVIKPFTITTEESQQGMAEYVQGNRLPLPPVGSVAAPVSTPLPGGGAYAPIPSAAPTRPGNLSGGGAMMRNPSETPAEYMRRHGLE